MKKGATDFVKKDVVGAINAIKHLIKTMKDMSKGIASAYKTVKYLAQNAAPILNNLAEKISTVDVEDINNAIPDIINKKAEISTRLNLNLLTDTVIGGAITSGAKTLKNSKWLTKADDVVVKGLNKRVSYENIFSKELKNFNDGYKIKNKVDKDITLVQYHGEIVV